MQREARKYLVDIQGAIRSLGRYTSGKQFSDYVAEEMLRDAVERKFEIVGVALSGLADEDELTADRISEYRKSIGFRNLLAHGYAHVDNRIVWNIVENSLPMLAREVDALLDEA